DELNVDHATIRVGERDAAADAKIPARALVRVEQRVPALHATTAHIRIVAQREGRRHWWSQQVLRTAPVDAVANNRVLHEHDVLRNVRPPGPGTAQLDLKQLTRPQAYW